MNDKDYQVYQALIRTSAFGTQYASTFPPTSKATPAFARLPLLIAEIGPVEQTPGTPASSHTLSKEDRCEQLWALLKRIAKTAKDIGRTEPGFDTDYRLGDDSQRAVIASATAFHQKIIASGHGPKFIEYDLPGDFIMILQGHLAAISNDAQNQATDQIANVGATAQVRELIKEGRALLKTLDTVVPNRYYDDPVILAEWRTASRIHRTGGSTPPPGPTPPTPPTP